MYYGITEKATRDYVLLYNNVGLNSKAAEEIASRSIENCRFRQHYCRMTPLSREPLEYPHKPYIARNWGHCASYSRLMVWVSLHSNFRGGLRKRTLKQCVMAGQGYPSRFWHQSKARVRLLIGHQ